MPIAVTLKLAFVPEHIVWVNTGCDVIVMTWLTVIATVALPGWVEQPVGLFVVIVKITFPDVILGV